MNGMRCGISSPTFPSFTAHPGNVTGIRSESCHASPVNFTKGWKILSGMSATRPGDILVHCVGTKNWQSTTVKWSFADPFVVSMQKKEFAQRWVIRWNSLFCSIQNCCGVLRNLHVALEYSERNTALSYTWVLRMAHVAHIALTHIIFCRGSPPLSWWLFLRLAWSGRNKLHGCYHTLPYRQSPLEWFFSAESLKSHEGYQM